MLNGAVGTSFGAEFGFAFGRKFELDRDAADISMGDGIFVRPTV
jgi:hypothetical protein